MHAGIIPLLETLKQTQRKPQRCYAAAALANAASHPRLASIINQNGGKQRINILMCKIKFFIYLFRTTIISRTGKTIYYKPCCSR